jgi:hypothetical protein
VTALDYLRTLYAGGFTPSGVAHSHDLLQIDYRELTPGTPWDAAVHEFFHAIQWTYRERALRDGARGRWSGFIAEATANWAAQVVAPAYTNGDVALDPEFCFVPLVYDPFAVGAPDVTHAYAGAIFMHYLTARLGGAAVNRVLGQAYQDATDDTQVLERAIRELDPSASLDAIYRQFVIDVLFHQRVGARALHDRPADTLKVPERMVTPLAIGPAGDQPVRVTRELTGRRHAVAGAIKLAPTVPSGARQTLTAELGGASWLWMIAEDATGKQRLVGGGASVRLTVDDQVRAVWLLPVSFADGALPLAVRMERSTRLAWKRTQVEISPPGGAIARSDDVSSLSGTVTERSITTTEVFAATGNRNTFTLSWTPPPERLEEGVPFAMELTGTAAGSSKIMSSFLVLAEDVRGSATFEKEGHPNVNLSLDLPRRRRALRSCGERHRARALHAAPIARSRQRQPHAGDPGLLGEPRRRGVPVRARVARRPDASRSWGDSRYSANGPGNKAGVRLGVNVAASRSPNTGSVVSVSGGSNVISSCIGSSSGSVQRTTMISIGSAPAGNTPKH